MSNFLPNIFISHLITLWNQKMLRSLQIQLVSQHRSSPSPALSVGSRALAIVVNAAAQLEI